MSLQKLVVGASGIYIAYLSASVLAEKLYQSFYSATPLLTSPSPSLEKLRISTIPQWLSGFPRFFALCSALWEARPPKNLPIQFPKSSNWSWDYFTPLTSWLLTMPCCTSHTSSKLSAETVGICSLWLWEPISVGSKRDLILSWIQRRWLWP